ncbi:MAG: hypothetical protein ACI9U2_002640 [Bradymonadia bacterium]|jgi:hypothetical protein
MSTLTARAALFTTLLAFTGCSSSTPGSPGSPDSPDSPKAGRRAVVPVSKASAPTAPPVDRWLRTPPKEPHPVAKGLYRRATALVHAGNLAGAEPLFKVIDREHPQSRFARRLQTEGFPIVEAAKMATVLVMFGGAALLFSADDARP